MRNIRGFPGSSAGKESTCNARDPCSIPRLGSSPGEGISYPHQYNWASLMAQMVKNCLQQETWVQSLSWEDLLEEGMATHSSVFTWRIPLTEEPGRLQSMVSQRVRHDWATNTFTFIVYFGAGHGNPLHYSGLGKPMERGAWKAYSSWGCRRVGHDLATKPQQYSWFTMLF